MLPRLARRPLSPVEVCQPSDRRSGPKPKGAPRARAHSGIDLQQGRTWATLEADEAPSSTDVARQRAYAAFLAGVEPHVEARRGLHLVRG